MKKMEISENFPEKKVEATRKIEVLIYGEEYYEGIRFEF